MTHILSVLRLVPDFVITLLLWLYWVGSYVLFFGPWQLGARLFARDREAAFQRNVHGYYRSFLRFVRVVNPGLRVQIAPEVRKLRGAVVVCNHRSYLDPLLLASVFPRHTTLVKGSLFRWPFLGWTFRNAGYLAATSGAPGVLPLLARLKTLPAFLEQGGVLYVFPEGTRSRDGALGPFRRGAFSLAARTQAPIELVLIRGTEAVFPPGRALFRTCRRQRITLDHLGTLTPPPATKLTAVPALREAARARFAEALAGTDPAGTDPAGTDPAGTDPE